MSDKYSSIHYTNYLQLDKIIDAQKLRSEELGEPAHDEMLFIIIHQVYELWFKQIIHEISAVLNMLKGDKFEEKLVGEAVHKLNRVVEIQKILIDQIKVLETMTPLDFLEFRNYLIPASGFQSYQFRVCEIRMGLKPDSRITYNKTVYSSVFSEEQQSELEKIQGEDSLFDAIQKWLERTPFLQFGEFDFITEYLKSVKIMTEREKQAILKTEHISQHNKDMRIRMLEETEKYIFSSLNEEEHNKSVAEGTTRLSYKATIAALLIHLYRDQPILRAPYNLLNKITEVDELFTLYRYRHMQMVLRMLGKKMGTGGSSGAEYLKKTVEQHHIFQDFQKIATLLIPRSELPILPKELQKKLDFAY
jgi:tryptophan 2,3-dioxygenase